MRVGRLQRIVEWIALVAFAGEAVLILGTAFLAAAALATLRLIGRFDHRKDEPAR
jgi:hypothetical protein